MGADEVIKKFIKDFSEMKRKSKKTNHNDK